MRKRPSFKAVTKELKRNAFTRMSLLLRRGEDNPNPPAKEGRNGFILGKKREGHNAGRCGRGGKFFWKVRK